MRKYVSIGGLLMIIVGVMLSYYPPVKQGFFSSFLSSSSATDRKSYPTHPKDAVQFELLRKANPVTMKVPEAGPWRAFDSLVHQGKVNMNQGVTFRQQTKAGRWFPVNDFFTTLSITGLTHDPNNPDIFYFCTGEGWYNSDAVRGGGIWRSLDAGKTWEQLPATDNNTFYWCQDIQVDPDSGFVYVATRNGGLQRSTDTGKTWEKVLGSGQGAATDRAADIEFTKSGGIFCTMGIFSTDGIYFSSSGAPGTWNKQTNGFPTQDITRIEVATAPTDDSIVYAAAVDNGPDKYHIKGFYKTDNRGKKWNPISIPGGDSTAFARRQGWYDLIVEVSPQNAQTLVAGGLDLWRSRDGGQSWTRLSDGHNREGDESSYQYVHVDQHEVVFKNSDTVYFGNDGGIWRTENFTDSMPDIYHKNLTYNVTQYYTTAIYPQRGNATVIGGTQDNGSSMSTDTGVSAFAPITGADGSFCAYHPTHPDTFYTSKQNGVIYRFLNGPDGNYTTIQPPYGEDSMLFINPFVLDSHDPDIIYLASEYGLWRLPQASSASSSPDWERAGATKKLGTISALGVTKKEEHTVFLGRQVRSAFLSRNVKLYRIDGADTAGPHYEPIDVDPNNQLPSASLVNTSDIYVDPQNGNHVIVTFSNYGLNSVFVSHNALSDTATWQSVEGDLPDIPVYSAVLHPANKKACYIATEIGVFYTKKLQADSTVWQPTNNGLAHVRTDMLKFRKKDRTLVAATHGRGIFTGQVPPDTAQYTIEWQERGPKNIGGRTRAIMIDPIAFNGREVWSASVSGGLWRTPNINKIPSRYQQQPLDTSQTDTIEKDTLPYNLTNPPFSFKAMPNPFGQQGLTFTYSIPYDGRIQMLIYDRSGRHMKELINRRREKGQYSLHWQPPAHWSDGIYYAQLRIGHQRRWITLLYFKSK